MSSIVVKGIITGRGDVSGRRVQRQKLGLWHFVRKLATLLSMDGEGFFKSKDWPCLWTK